MLLAPFRVGYGELASFRALNGMKSVMEYHMVHLNIYEDL